MKNKGFSLAEVMVAVSILSFLTLVLVRTQQALGNAANKTALQAELLLDSYRILTEMKVKLRNAGDGAINSNKTGKHLMADTPLHNPSIIFLTEDIDGQPSTGVVDVNDIWMRYQCVNESILRNTITGTINTDDIVNGMPGPIYLSSSTVKLSSPATRVRGLTFDLFTSDGTTHDPDGYQASYVRVTLWLERNNVAVKKDTWIFLRNIHYASTTGV